MTLVQTMIPGLVIVMSVVTVCHGMSKPQYNSIGSNKGWMSTEKPKTSCPTDWMHYHKDDSCLRAYKIDEVFDFYNADMFCYSQRMGASTMKNLHEEKMDAAQKLMYYDLDYWAANWGPNVHKKWIKKDGWTDYKLFIADDGVVGHNKMCVMVRDFKVVKGVWKDPECLIDKKFVCELAASVADR